MKEDYTILCSKELKRKYKKNKILNFIGYLIYRWNGYGNQRRGNDGWFYMSTKELVDELGFSKTTIKKFEDKLILDGMIEKRSGDFSARKANEYRVLFDTGITQKCTDDGYTYYTKSVPSSSKKCTDTESVQFTSEKCTEKCTEGDIDNEVVTEKSVPSKLPKKCTTDTDTDTEIDKETINIENGVMNKELVTEEKERNDKSTKTEINTTESINKAFHHFFNEGFKGGIYENVIKDVASSDDHRKTLWERWDIYCKWMKDVKTDISFKKMEQCLNAFLYLIGMEYTEPVDIKNKKLKCHHVYNALMKVFFLRQWKRFISNLKMYEPQDCKKTRVAFFDKVFSIYQDDEEREKTVSQMELEYSEAYKATNRNPKLKYEELDPDLKYQNLDETGTPSSTEVEEEVLPFTSTVQAVEKEETKTVSDMFNKVHAEWVKMKREYAKRGLSVPPEDVVKFINKVESMGYLTDYDLKVLHELVQEN